MYKDYILSRDGNQEQVSNLWSIKIVYHLIPFIEVGMFFLKLHNEKQWHQTRVYSAGILQKFGIMVERKKTSKSWLHFTKMTTVLVQP